MSFFVLRAISDRFFSSNMTDRLANKTPKEISDIPSQIQKLAELNRTGIITDEEFQAKKAELLRKL
jgi:hypothetical protein